MSHSAARYAWSGLALLIGFALGFAVKSSTTAEAVQPTSEGLDQHTGAKETQEKGRWLVGTDAERFERVERQLRGFDVTMMEIGYRFTELYFAGKDLNWDYAKYQVEKIEKAIELGLERRPKRSESAKVFLAEDLPIVLQAVQAKDQAVFEKSMDRLRSACMQCHIREKVPYFTVYLPERRISPVRPGP